MTYFLRSHLGQVEFEKWFSGSSGQIEIQPDDLDKFALPKSSENGVLLVQQKIITSKITERMVEFFELDKKSKEKWQQAKETFESLVEKEVHNLLK